jgi:hypothetical protein
VASRRAERLLGGFLTDAQRRQWREHGHFEVVAPSGTRYRVKRGSHRNVFELDAQGRERIGHCIYVAGEQVPEADTCLAQKLYLEHDEATFRRVANQWRVVA